MQVRCPHCQNSIDVLDDVELSEVECSSCGSRLNLLTDFQTLTYDGPDERTIAQFRLVEKVGVGAFGEVWKAHDSDLDRTVALKIPRHRHLDEGETEQFLREARSAAQLTHPGIVAVHEVGREQDHVYIVSDFVEGVSLSSMLSVRRPSAREAAVLCAQIADALHHAHESGVVHRDLKPGNIMIDAQGDPHVMDFGLAKRDAGEITMTMEGQVLGTPAYMSPEQARGEGHYADRRSDIFSLGTVMFELLTGERPFRGDVRMLLHQVIHEDAPNPRKLNANIPRDLETICLKCLRNDPAQRFATARDVADDLRRWLENKPILARPVSRAEKLWLWCKRRPTIVGLVASIVVLGVVGTFIAVDRQKATHARGLVDAITMATTGEVPTIVDEIDQYRKWAEPFLNARYQKAADGSTEKLHLALAQVRFDATKFDYLRSQLLSVSPDQFPLVCDALLPKKDELVEGLWRIATDGRHVAGERFQACCVLANYSPQDDRWHDVASFAADQLVIVLPSQLPPWKDALRPVKSQLAGRLAEIYRDDERGEQAGLFATDLLADYLSDEPDQLFDLLADADQKQFRFIFDRLASHRARAVNLGNLEISRRPSPDASDDERETLAVRQANAGVMLLRLNAAARIWSLLRHSSDPRVRSYLIHWLSDRGGDPHAIAARYRLETGATIKRALLHCLGEFDETQLPEPERTRLIEAVIVDYHNDPDAGLHAAAEWLLRQWKQADVIAAVKLREQKQAGPTADRNWYVNGSGQPFAILEADDFQMGSPETELGRSINEVSHRRRIGRRFAICMREITKFEWQEFARGVGLRIENPEQIDPYVRSSDSPMVAMTWFEAAWYCNWLSEQDGIPKDQWCYQPNEHGKYGPEMKSTDNSLELTGYRLPTESEWEFACRAGTTTSRHFGQTDSLLSNYAWYQRNSDNHTWPVGILKPNDYGLFDMQGNVFEWCFDTYRSYPVQATEPIHDEVGTEDISGTETRLLRGGAFNYPPSYIRSADRSYVKPDDRSISVGFRPARTLPVSR